MRPAQSSQILPTPPIVGEPRPELLIGPRIVTPADRTPTVHDPTVLNSSRYAGHLFDTLEHVTKPFAIDILAEAAGITAGAWYARPSTNVGHELIAAGMLILAGGGNGVPLKHDELER